MRSGSVPNSSTCSFRWKCSTATSCQSAEPRLVRYGNVLFCRDYLLSLHRYLKPLSRRDCEPAQGEVLLHAADQVFIVLESQSA
jgi:hypothetical protein